MMPPAAFEKADQFVPNWNSIGIPVTTPIDEIDSENPRPEARRFVVMGVPGSQREGLEYNDEQCQAHRELRKQVMKGYRECELNSIDH